MHHLFKLGESEIFADISRSGATYCLHANDTKTPFTLHENLQFKGAYQLQMQGNVLDVVIATRGDNLFIHLEGEAYQLSYSHPLKNLLEQVGGSAEDTIKAPMPGSLVVVNIAAGQAVVRGETLVVMESMKMETAITAPRDGVIQTLHVEKSQTFDRDALLISFVPQAGEKV